MSRSSVSCYLGAMVVALVALASSLSAGTGYRPPDLEKEIFDVKKIDIDKFDRTELVGGLIMVARDFDDKDGVDYETRAYALALAHRLSGEDKSRVDTVLGQLKADGKTLKETNERAKVSKRLSRGVRLLARKKEAEPCLVCAAYVCDVALRFDPKGDEAAKLKEQQDVLTKDGRKADWTGMLGKEVERGKPGGGGGNETEKIVRRIIEGDDEEKPEKKEVKMPGGTAKAFARNLAHANGLVVRQLDGGKFAGSASMVNATALSDKAVEGLLFTFNQPVGSMMGGSLEEVVKFLRLRYDATPEKIPTGFRIELGFQDKYVPKDGPSAATLFTLVLDSLFSGEEIDEGFACTGDITADGMVQKIGGTSGKIRGATKRGCKVVGIPEGNGKEVADVLVTDGPDQLLNIQIFTMKNFSEAHAISRTKKSPEVQATLDAFAKTAQVVKDKGPDLLKHPMCQKRLDDILAKMPNHLSAKLLKEYGNGTSPKVLSMGGSYREIDGAVESVFGQMNRMLMRNRMMSDDKKKDAEPDIHISEDQKKEAKDAIEALKKLSSKIDPKLQSFADEMRESLIPFADGPREKEAPKAFLQRIRDSLERAGAASRKIRKDEQIMEDLMD